MLLKKMLLAAVALGYTIAVGYGDEQDYIGDDVNDALDAIEAVEEASVTILEAYETIGWALVLMDLDEDEQIANCSGWCDLWLEANCY